MNDNKILYVYHKSGANSHYSGLAYLAKRERFEIKYREFSIFTKIIKSIFKLKFKLLSKQFINILFVIELFFTKNKKIIVGIAPYDYKLSFLRIIFKNHTIYYHTSWTVWDGSLYPKKKFVTSKVMKVWKDFIEKDVRYIFAVSKKTKSQLINSYNVTDDKVGVVYHSYDDQVFKFNDIKKNGLNFIYVGRLVAEKGIMDLLEYFSHEPKLFFRVLGEGNMRKVVEEYAEKYSNITYLGYISDKDTLAATFNTSDYILLNSYRTKYWEELFGMVLIEAMACGVVPVATNHTGPMEVITDKVDGFLIKEGNIKYFLDTIKDSDVHLEMRKNALCTAKAYSVSQISLRWKPVFNP